MGLLFQHDNVLNVAMSQTCVDRLEEFLGEAEQVPGDHSETGNTLIYLDFGGNIM